MRSPNIVGRWLKSRKSESSVSVACVDSLENRTLLSAVLQAPTNLVVRPTTPDESTVALSWTDPNVVAGLDPSSYSLAIFAGDSISDWRLLDGSHQASFFNSGASGGNDSITLPNYNLKVGSSSEIFGVQAFYPAGAATVGLDEANANQSLPALFVLSTLQPAPVLSATPVETTIQLSWTSDANATSYTVTDPNTNQVVVANTTATTFTDTNTTYGQPKSYQVVANFADQSQSLPSNIQTAVTVPDNTPLNYSSGFANAGNAMTYTGGVNATPYVLGVGIVFTDSNPINYNANYFPSDTLLTAKAAEMFSTSQFDTTFNVQITGGPDLGDTFGFEIGSVTIPFNFGPGNSTNTVPHLDTTGLNAGSLSSSVDMSASGVNPSSGDLLQVHLKYDGAVLTESVTDATTLANFTTQYTTNIPAVAGAKAQVGFYADTGAQEIIPPSKVEIDMYTTLSSWVYNPSPTASIITPLAGTPIGTAGSWSPTTTIANVFDGNVNTYFDPANGKLTNWVGLDLGAAETITSISYAPRADYAFRMVNAMFQVSSTPDFSSDVHTLATINTAPTVGQLTSVTVNPGKAYRFVRYVGGNQWVNIAEMQVFGLGSVKTGTAIGTSAAWSITSTTAAAFDGNLNTFFDPANGSLTNWVGLNLGTPQTVTQISFAPRAGYEFRMVGGMFQVSSTADFSSDVHTVYTVKVAPTAGKLTTVTFPAAGAYQYIRYTGGNQWVNIAEMVVAGPVNPTPIKLTGTAIGTAASWVPSSGVAAAFDGNLNTFFDPANGSLTNWVGEDLGAAQVVTQIKFAPRAGYEFRMVGGMFQASNTADFSSGVVTLATITTAPLAGQITTIAVNPTDTAYRYYRYIGGTQWVNIAEMELDG